LSIIIIEIDESDQRKGGNLTKAKAMLLVEPGRMELREFEIVPPQKDQILLKLGVAPVCASDPKIFLGKTSLVRYPVIMGHEIVGRVAQIGGEATARYGLKPGDRVTVEAGIPCGHCEWCKTKHNYQKCKS
jgi:alcohol dehydrogenase